MFQLFLLYRPWYIETARLKPRNVVILLDTSKSMSNKFNGEYIYEMAQQIVEIILNNLTPKDRVSTISKRSLIFSSLKGWVPT